MSRPQISPPLVIAGLLVLPVLMIGVIALLPRESEPRLTRSEVEAALARWKSEGVDTYGMEIDFYSSTQPVTFKVEVEKGEVVQLTRNDTPVAQRSTWAAWSVNGQFEKIQEDLEKQENDAFNVKQGVDVQLYASFDPRYGYPMRYQRLARGNPDNYRWEVKRFTPQ